MSLFSLTAAKLMSILVEREDKSQSEIVVFDVQLDDAVGRLAAVKDGVHVEDDVVVAQHGDDALSDFVLLTNFGNETRLP